MHDIFFSSRRMGYKSFPEINISLTSLQNVQVYLMGQGSGSWSSQSMFAWAETSGSRIHDIYHYIFVQSRATPHTAWQCYWKIPVLHEQCHKLSHWVASLHVYTVRVVRTVGITGKFNWVVKKLYIIMIC